MKFSISDVLWLTVVAALAVGWALDRLALTRAESRARLEAERATVAQAQAAVLAAAADAVSAPETTSSPSP